MTLLEIATKECTECHQTFTVTHSTGRHCPGEHTIHFGGCCHLHEDVVTTDADGVVTLSPSACTQLL